MERVKRLNKDYVRDIVRESIGYVLEGRDFYYSCPVCGSDRTVWINSVGGEDKYRCHRCGRYFWV